MPLQHLRALTRRARTPRSNLWLGAALCLVAGCVNSTGFLLVARFTSHMTGLVAATAQGAADGRFGVAAIAATGIGAFWSGAVLCTLTVRAARRRHLHSEYALPLGAESIALLSIAFAPALGLHVAPTLVFVTLCFAMGLQNALISKLSRAEIRTTHVTGLITDLGIEAARWLDALLRDHPSKGPLKCERSATLLCFLACFFMGSLLGALCFVQLGVAALAWPAILLAACAAMPILDDAWRYRLRARGNTNQREDGV